MKKNLITLAVAGALVAPTLASAEGEVSVYGRVQVEVANVDPQASGSSSYVTAEDKSQGRVGVLATEDLGGGLKGIARLEYKIDTADGDAGDACNQPDLETVVDDGGTPDDPADDTVRSAEVSCDNSRSGLALTKRELMVGLKGGFGQAELGRLKSAYKYAGGVKYDPLVATLLEARGNGGMSGGEWGHNGFNSNMIGYQSPKWGPVSIRATFGPEEDDSSYTASIKGSWKIGEFFLAVADQGDRQKGEGKELSRFKAGGQVRLGGGSHKISAQYEVESDEGDDKPFYFFAGYDGKFGNNHFIVQAGLNDPDVTVTGDQKTKETTYVALAAVHKFSKLTRIFGGYRMKDVDDDSGSNVISIGLRKDFK